MNEQLRKELRRNLSTNPFNDKFDTTVLKAVVQKNAPECVFLVSLFESYHQCYKVHFAILKDLLSMEGYTKLQLITIIINFANHHYMCVSQELMRKHQVGDLGKFFSETTEYVAQGFGLGDISGVSEAIVDTAASLINFISKFEYRETVDETVLQEDDYWDNVRRMNRSQSYLELVKHAYETPVWRNAYYVAKGDQLYIQFENEIDLQSFDIAQYRMQQKVFGRWAKSKLSLEFRRHDLFHAYPALGRGKPVEITRLHTTDGFLRTELGVVTDIPVPDSYLQFVSAIGLYYPFLQNMALSGSGDLRLYDLLYLYSLLQEIFEKLELVYIREDFSSKRDFGHISDKITIDELEYYFLKRTTYQLPQIHFFLRLMVQPQQGRINFWDSSMYAHGHYYQVMYNPLRTTVSFHLIDTMLEKCCIDLEFRGKEFERYIENELRNLLVAKGYYFYISPNNVEVNRGIGKEEQEIDLLLFLQDTILIAEVKCIKYPMETRDRHNAEKTLSKAAGQVIAKKEFLERNYKAIIAQLGVDDRPRKIVPLIIANYPTATGLKPAGIPVLDFSLFRLYFQENEIVSKKMTASLEGITEEVVSATVLYNNEQEFSQNLFSYCYDNPVINGYLLKTTMAYYQVASKDLLGKDLFKQYCNVDFAAESLGDGTSR